MSQMEFGMAASVTGRVMTVKERKFARKEGNHRVAEMLRAVRAAREVERFMEWLEARRFQNWPVR